MAIIRLSCDRRNTDQLYANLIQQLFKIDSVKALMTISIWCGVHQMHNTLLKAGQTMHVTNREWRSVIVFSPLDNILIKLVMPPVVYCVEKLDDHVEHVFGGVALEHGDNDQVEVCEITAIAGAHV